MIEGDVRGFQSADAEFGEHAEPTHVPEDRPDDPDRELLSEVLAQTKAALHESEPITAAEIAKFREIVARHPDGEDTLADVVADLAEVVLEIRFGTLFLRPEFRRRVSVLIAETLIDDPLSRSRLESFRSKLSQTAP
jgi:hypothetical protein